MNKKDNDIYKDLIDLCAKHDIDLSFGRFGFQIWRNDDCSSSVITHITKDGAFDGDNISIQKRD